MARQESAGTIINRTAVEVGLKSVSDPFSSTDEAFTQMVGLLNAAGQELAQLRDWNEINIQLSIDTTNDIVSGNRYTLPADYDRLIPTTFWDITEKLPVVGPLSSQDWAFLEGRDLVSNTIYASYRINGGQLEFYPDPPPTGRTLVVEYISRYWAEDSLGNGIDETSQSTDIVRLDPLLMQKFLKVKFLDAKGLPSASARIEFENVYQNRCSNDQSGPVLSASRTGRSFPYLNGFFNTPDTGYGS